MRTAHTPRLTAVVLAVALPAAPAHAQYYLGATYAPGVAIGDTRDFAGSGSWIGFSIDGRKVWRESVMLGFTAGVNEFYQNTTETVQLQSGAVSGGQYRHLLQFPLLLAANWFPRLAPSDAAPRDMRRVQPFIGTGIGAYYVRQRFEIGTTAAQESNWQFGVAPEAGLAVPMGGGGSFATLVARYHLPVGGGDFLGGGSRSFSYLTLGVGASYLRF